jgi:hypothetical protein
MPANVIIISFELFVKTLESFQMDFNKFILSFLAALAHELQDLSVFLADYFALL